jgi:multicomponent K+:H+ antiporter subunit D
MMTVAFGSVGILAAQGLARLASYSVLISAGTLLAATGIGGVALTAGALFYLVISTLAIAAFFMLSELTERGSAAGADVLAVTMEAYGEGGEESEEEEEVGVVIPATMALLGLSFAACALLLAGLPPLSGFIAKFLILRALLEPDGGVIAGDAIGRVSWLFMGLLLLSGFAVVIGMARAAIRTFWLPLEGTIPRVRVIEMAPILGLLLLCVVLTVQVGPAMRFIEATAHGLHAPAGYVGGILPPEPPAPPGDGQ